MSEAVRLVMWILLPMFAVTFIYRGLDGRLKMTERLVEKYPVLKRKKYTIQIFVPTAIVVIIAGAAVYLGLSREVFFCIAGCIAGFVNGIMVTLTINDK